MITIVGNFKRLQSNVSIYYLGHIDTACVTRKPFFFNIYLIVLILLVEAVVIVNATVVASISIQRMYYIHRHVLLRRASAALSFAAQHAMSWIEIHTRRRNTL